MQVYYLFFPNQTSLHTKHVNQCYLGNKRKRGNLFFSKKIIPFKKLLFIFLPILFFYKFLSTTSAQLLQTWAVASQSKRHPSTYFPGFKLRGTLTRSTTDTAPHFEAWFPEQIPDFSPSWHGGSKLGSGVSSQLVQSLPGVPGQGLHSLPSLHPPPRHLGGMGFIAHVEPSGSVPWSTYVPKNKIKSLYIYIRCT